MKKNRTIILILLTVLTLLAAWAWDSTMIDSGVAVKTPQTFYNVEMPTETEFSEHTLRKSPAPPLPPTSAPTWDPYPMYTPTLPVETPYP